MGMMMNIKRMPSGLFTEGARYTLKRRHTYSSEVMMMLHSGPTGWDLDGTYMYEMEHCDHPEITKANHLCPSHRAAQSPGLAFK
ncbi:hypothetical protein BGX31_000991, partial [Mortierella sp. GBA43]